MKIINPIYDKAFKYLMQNEQYARKVLSVILDAEIKAITLEKQEIVDIDESRELSLFRLDFKATIVRKDGRENTVLIKVEKSKYVHDLNRFYDYLSRQQFLENNNNLWQASLMSDNKTYPTVTIYLLGYNLPGVPYLGLKLGQELTNVTTREPIGVDDSHQEYPPYENYLIQIRRLSVERKTRLDRLFTLFNQAWVTEEDYLLDLEEVPEEFAEMAHYLHEPVLDEDFRRQLEAERGK